MARIESTGIVKKAQTAVVAAVIAGGLLLASPMFVNAAAPGPAGCEFDWNDDAKVRMVDIQLAIHAYGKGGHTIFDISGTAAAYGTDYDPADC